MKVGSDRCVIVQDVYFAVRADLDHDAFPRGKDRRFLGHREDHGVSRKRRIVWCSGYAGKGPYLLAKGNQVLFGTVMGCSVIADAP